MSRIDSLGIAKQAAMGTKQTVMEFFPMVESVEVQDRGEFLEGEETSGIRFPERIERGTKLWELQVKAPKLRIASAPRILSAFFGAPTTTTPEPGPAPNARQHVFDPAAAGKVPVPHSLLVTRKDPAAPIVDLFYDAKGDELMLEAVANGYLNLEAKFVALDNDDTQPAPTVTIDRSERFTFDQVKVYFDVNGGGENEFTVESWKLGYSNNLDADGAVLGSRKIDGLEPGNADAELEIVSREDILGNYRRALKDNPDKVKVRMEALGTLYGGATRAKCEVIAYLAEWLEAPAGVAAGSRLASVPIKARVAFDDSAGKFVQVTIVNDVTTEY